MMKINSFQLIKCTLLIFAFVFISTPGQAQLGSKKKNKKTELVSDQDQTGSGEVVSEKKTKKEIKEPTQLGLPLHDKYASQMFELYESSKSLADEFEFIKVEIIELEKIAGSDSFSEGGVTTDLAVTGANGGKITIESIMTSLERLMAKAKENEKEKQRLEALSKSLENEKVPLKLTGKSLKQTKEMAVIRAVSIAQVAVAVKNIAVSIQTLVRLQRAK